jgi:hypothetical protein
MQYMAGHWPMDCPELSSGAEKLLTKDQWKLILIFMARAQKDLDQ